MTNPEKRMLKSLQGRDGKWSLQEVLDACDWDDQAIAVSAGHGLSNHGFVKISESSELGVILGAEGENAVANGLLEARLWEFIQSNPNSTMKEISQILNAMKPAQELVCSRGWVSKLTEASLLAKVLKVSQKKSLSVQNSSNHQQSTAPFWSTSKGGKPH